jgi:Fe-S cluster assembly protein SufD
MTEQMTTAPSSLVGELSKRYSEPEWLRKGREQAWTTFEAMPSPKLEKSNLTKRSWDIGPFVNADDVSSERAAMVLNQLPEQTVLYFHNGRLISGVLSPELSNQGIIFTDLHTAAVQHPDLVQKYLGTVVRTDESKWAALNAALWHGGAFLYVPKNVIVDEVFHVVHEVTEEGQGAAPRLLIVGEEYSRFSYAEVYLRDEVHHGKVQVDVSEVVAKAGADITVASVNQYRKGGSNYTTRRAAVANDAHVSWVFGDLGDGYTVGLLESDLIGNGSRSTIEGIGLGYGKQHMDFTASMLHRGRYSESDMRLHGVLRGKANSVYRTSTHIFKNAVQAGSEQYDRMLMMESTARADAIPMLLIDENDVQRCGHAASVGKIDENQIYYLQSRGITKREVVRMIVWGYLRPTVDAFPSEGLRQYITGLIDRELA